MTTGNTYLLLLSFLVIRSRLLLWPPWSVARQAPLSMRFPGQGYWSGLLGCHFLQAANVICPLSFLLSDGAGAHCPSRTSEGLCVWFSVSEVKVALLTLTFFCQSLWDFPGGLDDKEPARDAEDLGSILGHGKPLEKGMATHSSVLAWRILWPEEPGGLQSIYFVKCAHIKSGGQGLGSLWLSWNDCFPSFLGKAFSLCELPGLWHANFHCYISSAVKFVVMKYYSEGKYKCKNNKRGGKAMRFWNGEEM